MEVQVENDDITAALGIWRDSLVNLTGVNRLIKFKASKTGTVIIDSPSAKLVADGLRGNVHWSFQGTADAPEDDNHAAEPGPRQLDGVRAPGGSRTLHSARADKELGPVLRSLMRRANTEFLDRGLHVLYMSFGMLHWLDVDGTPMQSPLLLVPVTLVSEGPKATPRLRAAEDDTVINPAIALRLREFGVILPVIEDFEDINVDTVFDAVRAAVAEHEGWEVRPTVLIACFSFHKEAMYRDLLDNEDMVLGHLIVRALATKDPANQTDRFMFDAIGAADIDTLAPPENTPMVLDADSSQRAAIDAAIKGHSFVMDGPPGTGKPQTIANMVGALLHAGKSVLFVSEKAAALEVVRNRLAEAGLENYLLELHSHKASRKEVAAALAQALDNVPVPPRGIDNLTRSTLVERRQQLNNYAEAMNVVRLPLDQSLHRVLGTLANLSHLPAAPIPDTPPADLTQAEYQGVLAVATRLERAWRPATQGQSYLWREVIDKNSLEIRLYQVESALEELHGISAVNHEVLVAFGLARPSGAKTLASLIQQQATRPAGVLDAWLTLPNLDQVIAARTRLRAALTAVAKAEREVVDKAGIPWDALPDPTSVPAVPTQPRVSPNPVDLTTITAATATKTADTFEADATMLQARLAAVAGLAQRLSLPEVETFEDIRRVLDLVDLGFAQDRPIRGWMSPSGIHAARNAGHAVHRATSALDEAETAATPHFTPAALGAPIEDLHVRFTTEHKGLRKLSGSYRRDKKALAAILTESTTVETGKANLPAAIAWKNATTGYFIAGTIHSPMFGHYWNERATDFAAHARAINTADAAMRLTPPTSVDGVTAYLCDGEPPPAYQPLTIEIRTDLAQWQQRLAAAPAFAGRPELLLESVEAAAYWLHQHVEPLRDAAARIAAVDKAIGRTLTLTDAHDLLAARARADVARQHIADLADTYTATFGDHYRGVDTDQNHLQRTLEWAKTTRAIVGSPLTDEQVKALSNIRQTDNLAHALSKWNSARNRVIDAFAPTRHPELDRELDDYRNAPEFINDLRTDSGGQDEWFAYIEARHELATRGLDTAIDFCIEQAVPDNQVPHVLERALLRAWADHVINNDERLRPRGAEDRAALVEEYRELDKQLIVAATSDIIRSANTRRPTITGVGEPGVIRREGMKKSRHKPVRELIGSTRNTSLAIKPCFMMSPLAVSQYLPPDMNFDVVIFDEASQVTPGDAINCIYRAKALILAGDDKQLPPTSFFERVVDEEDEDTDINDFQSILELSKGCGAFNNLGLKWHYRSRHEGLIAFSNHRFYGGKLVTYPSSHSHGDNVGVEFYPTKGVYRRGSSADNPLEAAKVAERVIEHYTTRPGLTLGVVTFSVAQADAIVDAVDKARETRRDLDRFFDNDNRLDTFFIKSLESVQGDERDVMIFSIGYGPDEAGKISTNFGVLNKPKGWRRLNVAITRARQRIEIVSSMRAGDIPPSQNENVQYLAAYLDYAERGPAALALDTGPSNLGPESPFEESVINAIRGWGYTVESQVGAAGFRLDIGVRHPAHPGVFAIGVECDGYQYHSAPAARDRDRLRDQVLRGLGWRLHRIWGTAWYRNRDREETRLRAAIDAAIAAPPDGRISSNIDRLDRPQVATDEVDHHATPSWTTDYETATVGPLPRWIDPSADGSRYDMKAAMVDIASVEGPVHIDVLCQRLRDAWNIGRIGWRIRENIEAAINLADVIREGDFIDLPGREISAVRRPTPEVARKIEQVPSSEITLAVTSLLRDAGTTPKDDLTTAIARIFGWTRTGSDINLAISGVIDGLVTNGTLSADGRTVFMS
jgi:hypothetical protein